jgi:CHAD domain-containing protein
VKQKPEESIRIYSAGLLLKQLEILSTEISGVRSMRDIEAVHQTRVSSRRIRAILDVFQDCLPTKRGEIWQKQIRRLTGALGAARDTDVQIITVNSFLPNLPDPGMKPGIRRLLLRLKQNRLKSQETLLTRLDEFGTSGVLEEMRAANHGLMSKNIHAYLYTPLLYKRSFETIHEAYDLFISYDDKIMDPANIKELHAMRVAGKNFRYTLECFTSLYSHELKQHLGIMKTAQELLGSIHDCDAWIMYLPGFIEKEEHKTITYFGRDRYSGRFEPGIKYLLESQKQNRETLFNSFIEKWNQWKTENIWDSLFQLLQVPFFAEKDIMSLSLIKQVKNGGAQ